MEEQKKCQIIGRWRFLVVFAAFWSMVLIITTINSFSLYHSRLLSRDVLSTTTVSWIFNLGQFVWNISFLFTGPLCEAFGHRAVALSSGALLSLSIIASGFLEEETAAALFFTYSVLGAFCGGTLMATNNFIIPLYFEETKRTAMSFIYVGFASGYFIGPPLVNLLQEHYGLQHATFIYGAVILNTCVLSMTYHPVKWHRQKYKHIEYPNVIELTNNSHPNERNRSYQYESSTLLNKPSNIFGRMTERLSVIANSTLSNAAMIKSLRVSIISFSTAIGCFAQLNFYLICPFEFKARGINVSATSFYLSISGVSSIVLRVILMLVIDRLPISAKWHSISGMIALISGLLIVSFIDTDENLIILSMIFIGASSGIITVLPLIILEFIGKEYYAGVYGGFGLVIAVLSLILGPITGLMKDITNNHNSSLHFLAGISSVAVSLWCLMPCAIASDKKRNVLPSD